MHRLTKDSFYTFLLHFIEVNKGSYDIQSAFNIKCAEHVKNMFYGYPGFSHLYSFSEYEFYKPRVWVEDYNNNFMCSLVSYWNEIATGVTVSEYHSTEEARRTVVGWQAIWDALTGPEDQLKTYGRLATKY